MTRGRACTGRRRSPLSCGVGDPYTYDLAPRAIRAMETLPEGVATAIAELIDGPLVENPHRLGKPLFGRYAGCLSARRGGYRVIYRVDDEQRFLEVVNIDHRRRVYGR